jgi:hypothetical protein
MLGGAAWTLSRSSCAAFAHDAPAIEFTLRTVSESGVWTTFEATRSKYGFRFSIPAPISQTIGA